MNIFVYDKTFEGLLTLVFDAYEKKQEPDKITTKEELHFYLFANVNEVITDDQKSDRVWKGLHKKLSSTACKVLYLAWLSENENIEMSIFQYIKEAFDSPYLVENNFGKACILDVTKIAQKVSHEAHRIQMFLRFQKTADDYYYSSFDPQYNTLPLMIKHFQDRFADQKWIIYDTHRKYGFYYDLEKAYQITLEDSKINLLNGQMDESVMDSEEKLFQLLWKNYFDSMAIKERINPRLHKQLLPKRFWKYLPEKNVF
jgi:probable DNA metabolism protein